MALFGSVSLDYVEISGAYYPRLSMLGAVFPSIIGPTDFYKLEKYEIDRNDSSKVSEAADAESSQIVMYYMGSSIYLSASLYSLGGADLGLPEWHDLTTQIQFSESRIVDTDANIENYMYIYRIIYSSSGTIGSSLYLLASEVPSVGMGSMEELSLMAEEYMTDISFISGYGSLYRLGKGKGTLYRESGGGIIVEKGSPSVHVTQRYRGPIELSKERARRTSMYGKQEHIDEINSGLDTIMEDYYSDIETINNLLVRRSIELE